MTAPAASAADFAGVDTWIFDLDNTLYPREIDLWRQVDVRIRDYIAAALKVDAEEAHRIRKDYYLRYGTSLRGMTIEHGIDPHAYLKAVHDIDYGVVLANARLDAALSRLPGRKLIFTNASSAHAGEVVGRLGIAAHFEGMFDILDAALMPKPFRSGYDAFLKRFAIDPARAAMFEDLPRNLEVPKELGMRTVLVHEAVASEGLFDWEKAEVPPPYVDFATTDIAGFLAGISAQPR